MHISACRAIPAGTELTTYYRDPFLPSSERHATLLAIYKFRCVCPSCLNPAASDNRRLRLRQSRGRLADLVAWARVAPPSPDLLADTLELLALVQEEGLESQHVYGRVLRHLMCISYVMQMCAEEGEDDIGSNVEGEGYEGYKRMLRAWRMANGAEEVGVGRVELAEEEMMRVAVYHFNQPEINAEAAWSKKVTCAPYSTLSDTGNRTPSCRALLKGGNVSRYTISELTVGLTLNSGSSRDEASRAHGQSSGQFLDVMTSVPEEDIGSMA
ncbi:hypothetical protein PTI98_004314 [Pleurotus ostreatus]|nr:hypothetical protein PTI98_004314 [Pleurotus ostreatus]